MNTTITSDPTDPTNQTNLSGLIPSTDPVVETKPGYLTMDRLDYKIEIFNETCSFEGQIPVSTHRLKFGKRNGFNRSTIKIYKIPGYYLPEGFNKVKSIEFGDVKFFKEGVIENTAVEIEPKSIIYIPGKYTSVEFVGTGWENIQTYIRFANTLKSIKVSTLYDEFNYNWAMIPKTVKKLFINAEMSKRSCKTLNRLPDSIENLTLTGHVEPITKFPKNIQKLFYGLFNFGTQIYPICDLSSYTDLTQLHLSGDQVIIPKLPEQLESLVIGDENGSIITGEFVLPSGLKELDLQQGVFDETQVVEEVVEGTVDKVTTNEPLHYPRGLVELKLPTEYNKRLDISSIPETIEKIYVYESYQFVEELFEHFGTDKIEIIEDYEPDDQDYMFES